MIPSFQPVFTPSSADTPRSGTSSADASTQNGPQSAERSTRLVAPRLPAGPRPPSSSPSCEGKKNKKKEVFVGLKSLSRRNQENITRKSFKNLNWKNRPKPRLRSVFRSELRTRPGSSVRPKPFPRWRPLWWRRSGPDLSEGKACIFTCCSI